MIWKGVFGRFKIKKKKERIARNPQYFTYLTDCRAKLEVNVRSAQGGFQFHQLL